MVTTVSVIIPAYNEAATIVQLLGRVAKQQLGKEVFMTDLFHEVASIDYPIIDADSHVNEPPNLWLDRIPAKFKSRAPRVVKTDKGDVWNFDDGKDDQQSQV